MSEKQETSPFSLLVSYRRDTLPLSSILQVAGHVGLPTMKKGKSNTTWSFHTGMYYNSVFNLVHFCQGKRSIFPWLVNISKSAYLLTIEHTILNTAFPMINYFFINTVCQQPFRSQTEIWTEESLKGIQSITITFWDGSHYACLDGLEFTLWTRLALNLQRDPRAPVSPSAGIKGVLPPCLAYSFIYIFLIQESKSTSQRVLAAK